MKRQHHFERKGTPLISREQFLLRLGKHIALSGVLILFSLMAGMAGYHLTEGMGFVDSFANAAMILSGMGPLEPLKTTGGKIFAGCYALYSGLVLILSMGFVLTPVAHRVLHRFHMESE